MATEDHLPGFAEMGDWPVEPKVPLRIKDFGAYRDPRPRCTFYVELEDLDGTTYHFFFDRFLGRLCYGKIDNDDDAAYLRMGSRLQIEAFAIIDELCRDHPEYSEILRHLNHAKNYV